MPIEDRVIQVERDIRTMKEQLEKIASDFEAITEIQESIRNLLTGSGMDLESIGILEMIRNHTKILNELASNVKDVNAGLANTITDLGNLKGRIPTEKEMEEIKSKTKENSDLLTQICAYAAAAVLSIELAFRAVSGLLSK